MEPLFETKPAFTVVGVKCRSNKCEQFGQLWEGFIPRIGEIGGRGASGDCYAVIWNCDKETGEFYYLAGVEVDRVEDIPEGMMSVSVPEQTYAVFPCTLPTISEAYNTAYSVWLPASGYKRGNGPELEHYGEDFADGQKMAVYIPIVKA